MKVNPGIATNVTCTGVRNPILQWDDLVLKKGSTVVNDGQPTAMEEREYSLTKQWAIVTHPLSVTVECSIRGTNVMQEREVSFYGKVVLCLIKHICLSDTVCFTRL